jgi:hypothetical protein
MPTFYRVVKSDPPTEEDFRSHKARGIPLRRDTPELRRSWEGVSVYDAEEKAREAIARFPRIGQFIAEVRIAEGGPVTFEQTTDDPHHYDLWGEPGDMLTAVIRVLPF